MDTKKTIMVVDDNPDIITIVKTILEGKGYNVLSASSGPDLLNLLKNQKPDLIVLDIMLPGRNGLDLCRDIRIAGLGTPILVLTARGETSDKIVGLKLGADDYVTKPFDMEELAARINSSDNWIVSRTGIRQRHIANDGELTSDLAVRAAERALATAGVPGRR